VVSRRNSIGCEKLRERLLPERPFSGKTEHHKRKYAISAAAMIQGGVHPDLFDDAAWWQADDLWAYSFYALLIYVRVAAERTGRTCEDVALSIAGRRWSSWWWSSLSSLDDVGCARHVNVGYPPATKATTVNWTNWSRRWESNPRPDDYKRTLPFRLPSLCVPGRLISAARRGSCPRGLKTGGPPCDTLRGSCWAEVGLKLIFQAI
jgi:hypothetical protein